MQVKPYVKASIRKKLFWEEMGQLIGLHPENALEGYFNTYFTSMSLYDFGNLVRKGKITKEDLNGADLTPEKIKEKEAQHKEFADDNDFCDLLNYKLKQIIEVGDEIVNDETKTYCFSGKQYLTAGKKYKIISLDDKREPLTSFSAQTECDIKGETNWNCVHGVKSLWRDGKEIWNWHLAYLQLWQEQNPNHPENQKMIDYCHEQAEKTKKGIRKI